MTPSQSTVDRLVAVLDRLGIRRAHVATQMPGDIADLAARHPDRVAGVALVVPARLDPAPFAGVAGRLLMISGASGITAEATARAAERLGGAVRHVLAGYEAPGWADVVADRRDELVGLLAALGERAPGADDGLKAGVPLHGEHAGITWRAEGRGPVLLLLPFFLAPSQWTPAIAALARHFTVVRLGGAHIGGVGALEDRARAPTYRAMFRTLVDLLELAPGARVLDVGCGSGALDRLLAERLGKGSRIDAIDINDYLVDEARVLAAAAGLGERIAFGRGSAEAIPFADAAFDAAFSVTVLEECDADKALAELWRVLRPGGRAGVVVRAIDIRQWWNLALPGEVAARAEVPAQSVGPRGVADGSLYARMRRAGFADMVPFPSLVTLDRPDGPIWRYREDHVLSQLEPGQRAAWQSARAAAAQEGLLFQAHAMHCVVARKPG